MNQTKALSMAAIVVLAAGASHGALANNCEQVKADIAAKIDANGVPAYSLTVIDPGAAHEGEVVGHCGGNTQHIVYVRGAAAAQPAATSTAAPAAEPAPAESTTEAEVEAEAEAPATE